MYFQLESIATNMIMEPSLFILFFYFACTVAYLSFNHEIEMDVVMVETSVL